MPPTFGGIFYYFFVIFTLSSQMHIIAFLSIKFSSSVNEVSKISSLNPKTPCTNIFKKSSLVIFIKAVYKYGSSFWILSLLGFNSRGILGWTILLYSLIIA